MTGTPIGPNSGLQLFRYLGKEPGFVLIVAGIHTSEQSGVEVARWINAILKARPITKPTRFGAVVIPEVFPDYGIEARTQELQLGADKWNKPSNDFREYKVGNVRRYPARHFPPPGRSLADLKKGILLTLGGSNRLDESGRPIPMLPQIRQLVEIVELIEPVRIVSVHGNIHDVAYPNSPPRQGIFVDPRYTVCVKDGYALETCKLNVDKDPAYPTVNGVAKRFDSAKDPRGQDDDALAKRLAEAVKAVHPDLVNGNHLSDSEPQVHYQEKLTDDRKPANERGYSLGDWGPVDVQDVRTGAPVFTIETYHNDQSWAFDGKTGEQRMTENGKPVKDFYGKNHGSPPRWDQKRAKQLHDLAEAIVNVILGS